MPPQRCGGLTHQTLSRNVVENTSVYGTVPPKGPVSLEEVEGEGVGVDDELRSCRGSEQGREGAEILLVSAFWARGAAVSDDMSRPNGKRDDKLCCSGVRALD